MLRDPQHNRIALTTCRSIRKRIRATRQSLTPKEVTQDGAIVGLLMDKADKTARAVLTLVARDYSEDALVLARSLAGLVIDVRYLTAANDPDRFASYRATGREARRKIAEQCGFAPPDAGAPDWEDVKKRAKRWTQGGAIHERAKKADCLRLYEYAYRHGSSFEHSDAWSLLTYEPQNAKVRDNVSHLALLVVAYALVQAYRAWAQFFGVDEKPTQEAIKKEFLRAFPAGL
ncbi:MAG TPA: DUF5677 domain-containing protein [Candidatus Bathyarchaeia archaeon]|nr:DUF5677 domain-containing protein [Candidatus Bathyarchaeia archaeon]